MSLKEYNHNYYINVYKDKIKNAKVKCEACKCEYSKWNESKHYKSKKHQLNIMSEEEKLKFIENKVRAMESKLVEQMKTKYAVM